MWGFGGCQTDSIWVTQNEGLLAHEWSMGESTNEGGLTEVKTD